MDVKEIYARHIEESCRVKAASVSICSEALGRAVDLLTKAFLDGKKVLICGNGGSAADAQHLATEFMSRLSGDFERPPMAAVALTTDTSFLTAHSNDYGFEDVFARQVRGLGRAGDVFIGFSTSGNSENIVRAAEMARDQKMGTVGFLGGHGGRLAGLADAALIVPSPTTMHVQETHLALLHVLVYAVERAVYGD